MSMPRDLFVDLDGPVHYADFGGDGPVLVLVHGLGGSYLNWLPVGEPLTAYGRVVAVDLLGHGRTPSGGRAPTVEGNVRMLGRFLDAVADGEPAVLFGNSMGGYLVLAEAAAQPSRVRAVVLVDAAMPLARGGGLEAGVLALFSALAMPGMGEALMLGRHRRGPVKTVRDTFQLCCVDPSRIARDVYDAHLALAFERVPLGRVAARDFLAAERSLLRRLARRRSFLEMVRSIRAETLVVQGERDRLVRLSAARALAAARPDWRLEVIDGVGHLPQLEDPARFLGVVEPWLADVLRRTAPRY